MENGISNATVASLADAWIEILRWQILFLHRVVASLAEAWIEIIRYCSTMFQKLSLPSRKRGLKLCLHGCCRLHEAVASLAEAWIEISP